MNAATEFDLGPLTWVKGEVDLALERASEALRQFTATQDATHIKFCRTHIHQVHGALSIVGLDGVTQVSESLEALLLDMEEGRVPAAADTVGCAEQAMQALRQYLDDLLAGEPNQPLRLLPAYQAMAAARGSERIRPSDLFFPDLSLRPPKRQTPAGKLTPDQLKTLLKQQRARFQKGLLHWLKHPEDPETGLAQMRDALRSIEASQDSPAARTFWWISLGFLDSLADKGVAAEQDARQLCARIDLQIRRLLEGSRNVAERLMRDALYYVAQAPQEANEVAQAVRQTYQLDHLLPSATVATPAPQEAQLRRLRETIVSTEELWNKFCAGSASALTGFVEHIRACAQLTQDIGQTDLKRLGQGLAAIANWLGEQPSRHSEGVAMEIATAILLLQNAQENFKRLGTDFAQQVDHMVARLHACIAGTPVGNDEPLPLLDDFTRRAQERLLLGQVAREIQNNLAQIEQALDAFFRDPNASHDLSPLDAILKQIAGAMTILGQDGALDTIHQCAEQIHRFGQPGYQANHDDFEALAQQLSILGFFVDSLQHGATDFAEFSRKLQGDVPEETLEEEEHDTLPEPTVEAQLEQQKKETQALITALKEKPEDHQLKDELKQNLQALQKDADLVADHALGETAKAALSALGNDTGADAPELDAALSVIKPSSVEAPAPSAETLQLAQSSHEEIDAELLEIFIEEAKEVLASMAENLDALRAQPHDSETLTTIRRGVHTLKGSGRMVGLTNLGETAWAVEQTLNQWLRQELDVNDDLLSLIDLTYGVFSAWVSHLIGEVPNEPSPDELVALAERLRGGEQAASASAPVPTAPPAIALPEEAVPVSVVVELPEPSGEESAPAIAIDALEAPVLAAEEPAGADSLVLDDIDFSFELPEEEITEAPPSLEESAPLADESADIEAAPAPFDEFEAEVEAGSETMPEPVREEDLVPVAEEPLEALVAEAPEEGMAEAEAEPVEKPVEEPAEEPATDTTPPAGVTASPTLYDIFREEARGHLDTLQRSFSDLELNLSAPTTFEMTRAAHTLGGIAATVGLMPINKLAITLEHALLRRDGSQRPDSVEGLEIVRRAILSLEEMFVSLAQQRAPEADPALIEALEETYPPAVESTEPTVETLIAQVAEPVSAEIIPLPRSQASQPEKSEAPAPTPAAKPEAPHLQDELDEQLLPIFLEEAQDLIHGFNEQLRAWRNDPDGGDAPRAMGRLLHTFKGSARMAGAMNLGEMTHLLETRVEEALHSGHPPVSLIDEIEAGCDALSQIVERIANGESPTLPEAASSAAEPAASEAEIPASEPTAQPTAAEAPVTATPASVAATPAPVLPDDEAAGQKATLRIRADLIDHLANEAGELSIARARIEGEMRGLKSSLLDLTENVIRLRRQLRDIEIQAETQMQARTAQRQDGSIDFDPLELDRFTRFQELTRFMAESVNDVATIQQNLLKNLDDCNAALVAQARINRSLQQELMSVRMVPFASQADRLYRVVRQAAKETGKRANLDIRGGQVELDRSVLDKMFGPLEHMLRNAVAHGVESREERTANGKPEIGEITLSLAQEGNEVILTLADDGHGLDPDKIRARAESAGFIKPGEACEASRLYNFIFDSGFSTADAVTQLAGRGIGMDVVKTEVGALGGRVEIASELGKGTTFRLYLPLTLAVTQTLLVRAGSRLYAIPSTMIEQVLELKEGPLSEIRDRGEAEWLGNRYPFHFLPHLLGDAKALPEAHRQYWVLLLRSGNQRVAVLVDELQGNQEVVVKNIGPQLARVVGIAGATVLGDGQVVLILNPVALASRNQVAAINVELPAETEGEPTPQASTTLPTVLVVDDSLTVRKITSRLLAREGYQVVLAKDGVDALEQLIDVVPDVMLSDVEMPRMDGFDLVRNVRADERLKDLPIIMITSRTADKHRNYALEIGANQYLGKPYDEEELLRLIAGYIQNKRLH